MQTNSRWHIFETPDLVASAASQQILTAAERAITESGRFKLVLAGGNTPEKIYRLLAQSEADWANWFIYYGDERCLAADDAERNNVLAEKAFLNHVSIPKEQIFVIPAELGNEAAAVAYNPIVAGALPFDMVLLGMGEDGHTASLFPKHVHPTEGFVHPVNQSPKPPAERVTLSAGALSDTTELLFLITGTNKTEIVKQWKAGDDLPIAHVEPKNTIDIYIDYAANNAL
jgi:6-phosphogluconolactonase